MKHSNDRLLNFWEVSLNPLEKGQVLVQQPTTHLWILFL